MNTLFRQTPFAAAIASGCAMGVAFLPYGLGFLSLVALVPFIIRLLENPPWRSAFLEALVASMLTTFIAGYWTLFHTMPSAASAAALALVILAVTGAIPLWCLSVAPGGPVFRFCVLVLTSNIVELVHFHAQIGFPWLAYGNTLSGVVPLNLLAAYIGAPGLSTWVLLSNGLFLFVVRPDRLLKRRFAGALLFLFLTGSLVAGWARPGALQLTSRQHGILAVQPALSAAAWSDVRDATRPQTLLALTKEGWDEDLELIIWPETALPVMGAGTAPDPRVTAFVDSLGVPLLTGVILETMSPSTRGSSYLNSAILITPDRGVAARYDKRILVPFAERVPYVDEYPWLKRLAVGAGGVTGYAGGKVAGRLRYDDTGIGVMICFESAFGRAARDAGVDDVAYYIVLGQVGWWGNTPGFRQHFELGRLRAVETGRAVVQVTVSGVSGLLLPNGTSQDETHWMERTVRRLTVPQFTGKTFYARMGDLPVLIFNLFLFCIGLLTQRISTQKIV